MWPYVVLFFVLWPIFTWLSYIVITQYLRSQGLR